MVKRELRLAFELARCELLSEFRQSFVGAAWLLITPLLGSVSWILLTFAGVFHPGTNSVSRPVFLAAGTVIWGFFLNIFYQCSSMPERDHAYLQFCGFPKYVLVLRIILFQAMPFLAGSILILCIATLTDAKLSWTSAMFPLAIIPVAISAAALGISSAAFGMLADSMRKLLCSGVAFLLYVTPVIYLPQSDEVPHWLQTVADINPLSPMICAYRSLLVTGESFSLTALAGSTLGAVVLFGLSWSAFCRLLPVFAEKE